MDKLTEMKKLVEELNTASDAYYNGKAEIMTDSEFDSKMELLEQLEKITGVVMNDSPLHKVGYKTLNKLEEVEHTHPMLSQKKIHSVDEIISFAAGRDIYLSLKLDGMSMALSYDENGILKRADSRGDGVTGSNCTHHVEQFINTPNKIIKSNYEIDGEAIIRTDDFHNYNQPLIEKATREGKVKGLSGEELDKYIKDNSFANARNLASGTLNSLDNKITKERSLRFIAWNVISGSDLDSYAERMKEAETYGFEIAPCVYMKQPILKEDLEKSLEWFQQIAKEKCLPFDGVVVSYNSISYVKSLGNTEKTPRGSVAYKYDDDTYPTKLKRVTFTCGKTGILTPNAEFEPVIIDGTTVTKASLYNISCMKELGLTNGCTCYVKKCNLIIPAVESCDNDGDGEIEIVDTCPVCGGKTEIIHTENADILMCTNPNCSGKLLKKMSAFVSKQGMDIDGLSDATLDLLMSRGYITCFKDIYHLSNYRSELSSLPKMGAKSVVKLLASIEKSRKTTLDKFLTSLSIPGIGKSTAKDIANYCHGSVDEFIFIMENTSLEFAAVDGIGVAATTSLDDWWTENSDMFYELSKELSIEVPEENKEINESDNILANLSFCITGKLEHYKNRDSLIDEIQSRGGTYLSGVSSKLDYLICNSSDSNSSKAKKALSLNVKIISEADFMQMCGIVDIIID